MERRNWEIRPLSPRSSRSSSTTARYSRSRLRVRPSTGTSSGRSSTSTRSSPRRPVWAAPAVRRAGRNADRRTSAAAGRVILMAQVTANGIDELKELIGQEVGPSDWREVTQELIDTFAEVSGDDQWIHVDVERAKTESPFGTTVARGNLTRSLIDGFRKSLIESTGFVLGVNYGWNKVRFPAPVPAGSRVRATSEVVEIDDVGGGWF